MLRIAKIPKGEPVFKDYAVKVNGQDCPVWQCRVSAVPFNTLWPGHQRPIGQSELAGFISFSANEKVDIEVRCKKTFKKAVVRPLSEKIIVCADKKTVGFSICNCGQYVLELDDEHFALHIFINKPEDFPEKKNADYYFGPGIHKPGVITVKNGDKIYIDEGAVVYGSVFGRNVKDVKVFGHGILDGGWEERRSAHCYEDYTKGCIKFYESQGLSFNGVILRDSAIWVLNLFACDRVNIDNIKLIGHWKYNCDGIDIMNSSDIRIENSFVRAFDDVITLKGILPYKERSLRNIFVKNCVLWCGWGRTLEIGLETMAEEYTNIIFEDCDLIHNSSVAMDIQCGDYAKVHNIRFVDIRVEYQKNTKPERFQSASGQTYPPFDGLYMPQLIFINAPQYWCDDAEYDAKLVQAREGRFACVENIHYKNISVYLQEGMPMPPLGLEPATEKNTVKNIMFEEIYVNGIKIERLEQLNYSAKNWVAGVILK